MNAAREYISDIAEIISMPDIYRSIRKLMQNPQASESDYVRLFESDSMLARRIMRIANSNYFGFNRPARDLYEAIKLIGTIQLHDLYVSSLCMRAFYNIPPQILNTRDFWQYSIQCGITARTLAKLNRIPGYNRFFTLGFLIEIGHAVMYLKTPEQALQALLESQQYKRPIHQVERDIFGFDYCQLGSAMMRVWHLPDVYPLLTENYLTPDQVKPELRTSAEIINFASRMCASHTNNSDLISEIKQRFKRMDNLAEDLAAVVASEIRQNAGQIYEILSPPN